MLRKIALSSMKGRKKDTLILSSVIILSFIFITITTVFHTSSERTKYEQKTAMFGKWDLAYYNGDKEIEEKLLGLNDVEKLGVSRIIGGSSTCGTVGTFNQDLMDLGYFSLHEGRMPENNDEIALELNQLKEFSGDIKVGDTIPVKIEISVINRDSYDVSMEQTNRVVSEIYEKANELGLKTDEHVKLFYYNYRDNYKRNTRSLEVFNDTEIAISTSYIYEYIKLDLTGAMEQEDYIESQFERIETDGSILNQKAYIKRDMIVTGIFETYSIYWDKGYHLISNAFITEGTGEDLIEKGYYLTKEIDASAYKTPKHLFIDTKLEVKDFYDKYSEEFEKLKINSFLHSQTEYETENTLTFGILLSVFIATMLTVFLIYFTQMKRRARRIALQKSIGATNGQIGKLFFWELFYILTMTIPIGIVSGISIGKIILFITNKYGKTKLNFHIDYRLTGLGVSIGILAIFISMLVPIIISMKIPLTGTISEPPKRKRTLFRIEKGKIKSKELGIHNSPKKINPKIKQVNLNMKIQTFSKISLKNIKYHKGKHLLTLGLYTINITVLLGCILLSFLFFGDYINNILITGKPSYGYEVNYGMIKKEIKEFTEELNSIKGVKDVTVYKGGERAFLWYEGIQGNILQRKFKEILPDNLIKDHFGIYNIDYVNLDEDNNYLVRDAIVTNIYGIDVEAKIYKEFESSITKGTLNKERFESGEEVILMLPMNDKLKGYDIRTDLDIDNEIMKVLKNKRNRLQIVGTNKGYWDGMMEITSNSDKKNRMKAILKYTGICDISYDFRNSKDYFHDYSIRTGERIYLTIPTENYNGLHKINDVAFNDVEVAALIYYFPEVGIWPFADTIENPVIIGSYNLTEKLYPVTTIGKRGMDPITLRTRIATVAPTRYGKSWIYVETNNKSFGSMSQVSLAQKSKEKGFKLHDYKEGNDRVFRKAFNTTLIIIMLGIAVAFITSIILYNTSLSKLEQERDRIGTFQALGVTREQFQKQYLITGFSYGMISLVISHIVLIMAIMFTSIGNSRPMLMNTKEYINYIIQDQLWLYPWTIHILVSIIFFVTAILTYYLPLKRILDNQPIDNIRSLGR